MRHESFSPEYSFDRFLTYCRNRRVFNVLDKHTEIKTICDLGCGSGNLIRALRAKGYDAFGIDVKEGVNIVAADLNLPLPIKSDSVDLVVSLANIEHLHEPLSNLREIRRILRPGGALILTTPSTGAKPVLEFLAFKLKVIDPVEIRDHKMYFSKKLLKYYLDEAGFSNIKVSRFQLGMNLQATAVK